MVESLLYLEFNVLYDRLDATPNWVDIVKSTDGTCTAKYMGTGDLNLNMVVHEATMEGNTLTMRRLSLSDLYIRYNYMSETLEIMEDMSTDYYKYMFHAVTKDYYLKRYLSNSEQVELLDFIERKSKRYSEASKRILDEIIRPNED